MGYGHRDGKCEALIGHKKDVYAVAFSPDSRLLASASADKSNKLWNVASGREIRTLSGHRNWVTTTSVQSRSLTGFR